jgi:hypothetical protein
MVVAPGVNPGDKEITKTIYPSLIRRGLRGGRGEFFRDTPEEIRGTVLLNFNVVETGHAPSLLQIPEGMK